MDHNILNALSEITREKSIDKSIIIESLEAGLQAGWFFPGSAFERPDGSRPDPVSRILARAAPERAGLVVKDVDIDHPVQIFKCFAGFTRVRPAAGGVLSPGKKSLEGSFVHFVKQRQPGIIFAVIHFRQPAVTKFVFGVCVFTEKRLEHAD